MGIMQQLIETYGHKVKDQIQKLDNNESTPEEREKARKIIKDLADKFGRKK